MSSFGSPLHDTMWILKKSKNNKNGNYFLNWEKSVLFTGRPKYTQKRPAEHLTDSEDDDYSLINVSESEDESEQIKRVQVTKRNKRLRKEENDNSIQIVSIRQPLVNEKILETLWKLYRNVGETIEDIKHRLVDLPFDKSKTNFEFGIESVNHSDVKNMVTSIKDEILIDDESLCSENESLKKELSDCDSIFEEFFTLSDILAVEIHECDRSIQLTNDHEVDNIKEECKDSILKAPTSRNPESLESIPNCTYAVPCLKQITNAELVTANKFTASSRKNSKSTSVEIEVKKKNSTDDEFTICNAYRKLTNIKSKIKNENLSCSEYDEPIITEMCDISTRSYNRRVSRVNIPKCFKVSRLSDSSNDEEMEVFDKSFRKNNLTTVQSAIDVRRNRKRCNTFHISRHKNKISNKIDIERSNCDMLSTLTVDLSSDSVKSENINNTCVKRETFTVGMTENLDKQNFQENMIKSEGSDSLSTSLNSAYTCTRSSCSYICLTSSTTSSTSDDNNNEQNYL